MSFPCGFVCVFGKIYLILVLLSSLLLRLQFHCLRIFYSFYSKVVVLISAEHQWFCYAVETLVVKHFSALTDTHSSTRTTVVDQVELFVDITSITFNKMSLSSVSRFTCS